jgi:hypothetical protein
MRYVSEAPSFLSFLVQLLVERASGMAMRSVSQAVLAMLVFLLAYLVLFWVNSHG